MEPKIGAFEVSEKLHQSHRSTVYRARDPDRSRPVILKLLSADFPSPEEIFRYRHEFEVTRSLTFPEAIGAIGLLPYQSTLMIILEDFGADSLSRIAARRRFTVEESLSLAIKIAHQLASIHASGIIHRDVNPSNIVFNESCGVLKIIDFGIASSFTKETPAFESPNALQGTLAYISPEQTGRMNRSVDARSDFYGVGATLFELLVGHPPFVSSDPGELVFCHLARAPRSPSELEPEIPEAVSRVVLKLLAKTVEERYQSAHGIIWDLEHCLAELRRSGAVEPFPLGTRDVSERLVLPERLYGRSAEVERLLEAFERTARGARGLLLVSGGAGIGKTSAIREVQKPVTGRRGLFGSGKFDQLHRGVPASALVGALRSILHLILAEDEASLAEWRLRLQRALGPAGQVLVNVLPDLERIVGVQPALQDVGPGEAQARFAHVFRSFVRALSADAHPLVLFLDDLQWADDASLRLIEVLATDEGLEHFLMIGAYRANEVDALHPMSVTLSAIAQSGAHIDRIELGSLAEGDVTALLEGALARPRAELEPLARLVMEKTAGNPFFVHQFLHVLEKQGLLAFDRVRIAWRWDLAAIEAQSFTDNVVELVSGRLEALPARTKRALRTAALLGGQFHLRTLAKVLEEEASTTLDALGPVLAEGVLLPVRGLREQGAADLISSSVRLELRFAHDRLQQAAQLLIPRSDLAAEHLAIGRLLRREDGPNTADVFAVVAHLNRARELLHDPDERLGLARLNLEAGECALAAQASDLASHHFALAFEDLGREPWARHPELGFRALFSQAKAEVRSGRLDVAESLLADLIRRVEGPSERASVYVFLIRVQLLSAQYEAARDLAVEALALFGIQVPKDPGAHVPEMIAQVQGALAGRSVASLVALPATDDPQVIAILDLWGELANTAFVLDPSLLAYSVLNVVALSLERGVGSTSLGNLAFYGLIMGQMTGDFAAGFEFARVAIALASRFGFLSGEADACLVYGGYLGAWVEPIQSLTPFLERGYKAGLAAGVPKTSAYNLNSRLMNALFEGVPLRDLLANRESHHKFAASIGNVIAMDLMHAEYLAVTNLAGETSGPEEIALEGRDDEAHLAEWQAHASSYAICVFLIERGMIQLLYGKLARAIADLARAEPLLGFAAMNPIVARHAFFTALAHLFLSDSPGGDEPLIHAARTKLDTWSRSCPANFRHMLLLVDAERARRSGDLVAARLLYEDAIEDARRQGFEHHEAIAHERIASLLLEVGKEDYAKLHVLKAKSGFERWGARFKVAQLEERYFALLGGAASRLHTSLTSVETTTSSVVVDAISVVKAAQSISSEIVLDRLLSTLMRVVLENAGAERGTLFLTSAGGLVVAAEGRAQDIRVAVEHGTTLGDWTRGPRSVIHFVKRTLEHVVVGDATKDPRFSQDAYIQAARARSILCIPIVKLDRLAGVLYLENDLAVDAFTQERIAILRMLAGQMAVSLENASLLAREHEARADAERAVLLRDDFLVVASHELNTPMTSLTFLTQGLLRITEKASLSEPMRRQLELLDRQARRLKGLVTELLDVSRIQAGKLVMDTSEMSLPALAEEVLARFEVDFARASVVSSLVSEHDVTGCWDRSRLDQVITNLLANALKFGPGQPVTMEITARSGWARLSVTDRGIGIAAADQTRVFDRFERAVPTANFGGLGLGLFLSRSIVEAHGGRIGVESELGKGATFFFELPL